MKHITQHAVGAILLFAGLLSCSYAQSRGGNPCKNPEFGFAEEGFANCKPQNAFARLQVLAKQGDPKALYMLGNIYNDGGASFGLPEIKSDGNLAMKYFLRSAEGGYAEAQALLADYYWRDYHETRQKEALYWACRAAVQNYPNAVAGIQLQIKVAGSNQTVSQYCAPILKSPPKDAK